MTPLRPLQDHEGIWNFSWKLYVTQKNGDNLRNEDSIKIKMASECIQTSNEDDHKTGDDLKTEDDLKNEDDIKLKDDLKNEDCVRP